MSRLVFDIDSQNDFLLKSGAQYVGDDALLFNGDSIITNIEKIMIESLRNEVLLSGTVVSYDEEIIGRCIQDTYGCEKINETMMVDPGLYYTVGNSNHGIDLNVAQECWQVIFEKQHADIWDTQRGQPDNLSTLLRTEDVTDVEDPTFDHLKEGSSEREIIWQSFKALLQGEPVHGPLNEFKRLQDFLFPTQAHNLTNADGSPSNNLK